MHLFGRRKKNKKKKRSRQLRRRSTNLASEEEEHFFFYFTVSPVEFPFALKLRKKRKKWQTESARDGNMPALEKTFTRRADGFTSGVFKEILKEKKKNPITTVTLCSLRSQST